MMKRTYRIMANHPEPSDAEAARWQNFDQLLDNYRVARRRRQRWWGGALLGLILLGSAWGLEAYRPSSSPTLSPEKVASQPPQPVELALPPVTRRVAPPPPAAIIRPVAKNPAALPSPEETFIEAVPAGGYPALYAYFASQLRYPESARRDKVSGTVLLEFTIDTLGQAAGLRVVQGVRDDLNQEAIRLVTRMPAWTPASVGQKPVATKHTMPLYFQLTNP